MRVITQNSLLNSIFAEIQRIELDKGSCHYGDYNTWCISGKDVETAIKNVFAENGVFKPTKDLIHCRECKYWQDNNGGYPHRECRWGKDETPDADDYCSFAERTEEEILPPLTEPKGKTKEFKKWTYDEHKGDLENED